MEGIEFEDKEGVVTVSSSKFTEEEIADVKGSMLDEFVDIGKLFADL